MSGKKDKILVPTFFTYVEGGSYIKYEGQGWTAKTLEKAVLGRWYDMYPPPVDAVVLRATVRCHNRYSDYHVHSLMFGDYKDPRCPRWDTINGWTTELPEL